MNYNPTGQTCKHTGGINIATTAQDGVVRQPAEWMRGVDDRILETIRDDGNMTPLALSREGEVSRLDIGRKYAGIRCRKLVDYGLLTRIDRGLYGLADDGRSYLDEELDASTLEPED